MNEERDVFFIEVQKIRQLWVQVIIFLPLALVFWHWNDLIKHPITLIFPLMMGILCPVLIYLSNLRTEIRRDGLYFRFFPYHLSFCKINLSDIDKYEARTYRPIMEYGGWGIRYSLRYGKAYNVSGNLGIQLVLKNGSKILFGSQKPEEFVEALKKVLSTS
ncbi:MAG: DUF6141 family protein [Candidatus Eremiobacterota bacterium]